MISVLSNCSCVNKPDITSQWFYDFFPVNVFFLTAVGNSFCNLRSLATPYSVYLNYIKGGTLKYLDDIRPEPSFPKQFMVLGAKI